MLQVARLDLESDVLQTRGALAQDVFAGAGKCQGQPGIIKAVAGPALVGADDFGALVFHARDAMPLDAKWLVDRQGVEEFADRKSTRLNSSHVRISYAVFCLKKKKTQSDPT